MALSLLLWKNLKLKQRQWGKTIAEIVAPLAFFLLLVAVRKSQDFFVKSPDCQFKPSALVSKGLLPALQSFCFFGVCQREDTGYAPKSMFNESELRELNEAAVLFNQLYSDPVLSKYRSTAELVAGDLRNPAAMKQLELQSFFSSPTSLFDNVTSTEQQRSAALNATVAVPNRLNLEIDAVTLAALSAVLRPAAGQLVCTAASADGNSTEWSAVAALCNQTSFVHNLQAQLNFTAVTEQLRSNRSDAYTLQVQLTDIPTLVAFVSQVSNLTARTTVLGRISSEFGGLLAAIGGGAASAAAQLQQVASAIAKFACGAGDNVMTKMLNSFGGVASSLAANLSSIVNSSMAITALLPPESYCYNQTIIKKLTSSIEQLLKSAGLSQLTNLLFGDILYFPDNNGTRQNLQKLNETLSRIGLVADLAKVWIETEQHLVADFIANSSRVQEIRMLLGLCLRLGAGANATAACRLGLDFLAPTPRSALHWTAAMRIVQTAMFQAYHLTACFKLNKLRGFDSEAGMDNHSLYLIDEFGRASNDRRSRFFAAIAFDTGGESSFEKYRLRMLSDKVDSTRRFKVMDRTWTPEPRSAFPGDFKYYTSFFLHVQELLEQGIAERLGLPNVTQINYMRMFPTPCFVQDQFIRVVESSLPMIMTLSWIYSLTLLVNAIVYEKESRLKEMMKIMGLSDGVHWLAWFITSFSIMLVASLFMTLLIKAGSLIVYSNTAIIFLLIISFVVATICEGFLISVFFSNSSVASAFAGVIFFVGYLPYTVVDTFVDSMGPGSTLLSCLLPQVAFGLGCKYIGQWELGNIGVQPSNFRGSPISANPFPFAGIVFMLWVDALLMMLLTWYIEKVFPGRYGVPKPFYFLFTKSYWCGASAQTEAFVETEPSVEMENNSSFEEEPQHLKVGVAVKNLCKVYSPGICACKKSEPFTAVNNLSYRFYEEQVTSFLGHNGAGKSTTVSILTGLYTPTSGTASIYGYDIRTQMDQIRRHLGLCPQHNVLFNHLTVEDHIYFYGMLKGLKRSEIEHQIDRFVTDVGLDHKRHELSCNLSGGMKRKLSVAMAFVGNSKLIILDEPTAGVDPHARRSIWDVLTQFRAGRTILLTTHHMDEADILGDRICIIDKGKLVCSGSPMFLKKAFGHGYTLTLVLQQERAASAEQLLDFVRQSVPGAQLGEQTPSELNLKLPFAEANRFDELFEQLDAGRQKLGVDSYGIEDCSLEEIFLSVTGADREETVEKDAASVVNLRSSRSSFRRERATDSFKRTTDSFKRTEASGLLDSGVDPNVSLSGSARCVTPSAVPIAGVDSRPPSSASSASAPRRLRLRRTDRPLLQQVKALWVKRLTVFSRSKLGFLAEFLLPILFILLSLAMLKIVDSDGDNPAMELAPWYMLGSRRNPRTAGEQQLFSFYESRRPEPGSEAAAAARVAAHFGGTESLGCRCVQHALANAKFPCRHSPQAPVWSPPPPRSLPDASSCSCSYEDYPRSAQCVRWPQPPRKALFSSDLFENLTQYNVTNYIQSTVIDYYKKRFGGFALSVNDSDPATTAQLEAAAGNLLSSGGAAPLYNASAQMRAVLAEIYRSPGNSTQLRMQVWYENRGYVSGPAYLNVLHNAVLRSFPPADANRRSFGISGWTHPITLRSKFVENVVLSNTITSAITVISVIFAMSFIPASFVLFLITERETNAKHLQFVSGINPTMYWLVNHAWNMVNYAIPLAILVVIFALFRSYEFVGQETLGPFLIIMLLFGLANAPLMYPFSWVMDVPSKAFTLLSCLNLGIGFVTTMSVTIVEMIAAQNNDAAMKSTADVLKVVFLVFPHFCLGQGLMELTMYYQFSVQLGSMAAQLGVSVQSLATAFGEDLLEDNPWDPTRKYILCLLVHSVVYFLLVILIEYNFFCSQGCCSGFLYRCCHKEKYRRLLAENREAEDDDVATEREKVQSAMNTSGFSLLVRSLAKVFHTRTGPKAAVRGVSLAIAKHECFGFLGVNGAGKTTTFKMLTGDINPSSGEAFLNGFSILHEVLDAHKQLGYCPQFDAMLPLLTGRETLRLFARIRGIHEESIPGLVDSIADTVGIRQHLDKLTSEYSGGNKRKLSCGVAFIGEPPIVFLDEPTAGMDPGARRFLWRCIQQMVAAGSCVVLTSHSMEDCQALCHRLTIMVNGQLKCIGSPQHLKTKFGQGFTVFLRLPKQSVEASAESAAGARANPAMADVKEAGAEAPPQLTELHSSFVSQLPEATLKEQHGLMLQYQVPQTVPLSRIFAVANSLRQSGSVQDYSVNQTTLDQVFINFAKKQTEMTKDERRGSRLLTGIKREMRRNLRASPASGSPRTLQDSTTCTQLYDGAAPTTLT